MGMVSPILPTKKDNLVLNKPPLIKGCTDIKQFVKQPFHLNYSNHAQSVERAVKLTTTASGQIAGAKMQIGEELCNTAGRKKAMDRKRIQCYKKAANASQKNQSSHCYLLCINCIFSVVHHFMQAVVAKLERKC